jgi:hypothetical protein
MEKLESLEEVKETVVIDLIQTAPNPPVRAYIYKLVGGLHDGKNISVLAVCATAAKDALKQNFPLETVRYLCMCELIMQVN